MDEKINVFLPGLDNQLRFVRRNLDLGGKSLLVMGPGSEEVARIFSKESGKKVEIIVEDYNSLMNSRLITDSNKNINVRLMDFEVTDFDDEEFDVIYTQGAISNPRRNKIVKEIKRILKPEGYVCVGEVVSLQEENPQFVLDIYESSELSPLSIGEIAKYYQERKLKVIHQKDLSFTLMDYYSKSLAELKKSTHDMSNNEKSYYKKLINMISHESKAFLSQGADEFIGFYSLILKKDK